MAGVKSFSRREFLVALGGAAVGGAVATVAQQGVGRGAIPVASHAADASGSGVEQNSIRLRGVGVLGIAPGKVQPGLTLITPAMSPERRAYLVDVNGAVRHEVALPYIAAPYVRFTDKKTILGIGRPAEAASSGAPLAVDRAGIVYEMDASGRILWELRDPDTHHDAFLLKNGHVLLLCRKEIPQTVASQVQGIGRPDPSAPLVADYLLERTTEGDRVWEWRSWEHLNPAEDLLRIPGRPLEWTHGNSIEELPNGNILFSMRNVAAVVEIDRQTGNVVWKLQWPLVAGQHAATRLKNGRYLIFDNGFARNTGEDDYSRVIEVNSATSQIEWRYADYSGGFFSPRMGGAQRLPNGNTLICDAVEGRVFEVLPSGEKVWIYRSPHFSRVDGRSETNQLFRAFRYTEDELPRF